MTRSSLRQVRLHPSNSGCRRFTASGQDVVLGHAPFVLSQMVSRRFSQSRRTDADSRPLFGYSGSIEQGTRVQLQQYQFGQFHWQSSNEVNSAMRYSKSRHQLSKRLHDVAAAEEACRMMLLRQRSRLCRSDHRSGWLHRPIRIVRHG